AGAGSEGIVIGHERDGTWRPRLLDGRTAAERALMSDLPGEVEALWYPDGQALLLRHDFRGRGELYRYDLGRDSTTRVDTPTGSIDWAAVRPDGAVWFALSTSESPRSVVTLDGARVLPR